MPISATSKDTGVSVQKVKPIADLIRGKSVGDALEVLDFFPSPRAGPKRGRFVPPWRPWNLPNKPARLPPMRAFKRFNAEGDSVRIVSVFPPLC